MYGIQVLAISSLPERDLRGDRYFLGKLLGASSDFLWIDTDLYGQLGSASFTKSRSSETTHVAHVVAIVLGCVRVRLVDLFPKVSADRNVPTQGRRFGIVLDLSQEPGQPHQVALSSIVETELQ